MNSCESKLAVTGHVLITDPKTGDVLFDNYNSINFENLSVAIVQSLISGPLNASLTGQNGFIYKMVFGNGGTTVDSSGIITYNPPNTVGSTASLYNQTYSKVVNNQFSANSDALNNNLTYNHIPGKSFTDIVVSCLLDYGEPAGQLAFDNANSMDNQFAFDELGLESVSGLLLSHVIYSPIIKSNNRTILITYTIRISTLSSLIN